MLLALALISLAVPVENSVFGCAVLSVGDLDGDGVREIAVADAAWVHEKRRHWAIWLVSGAKHERLAFHSEDYGDEIPFLRMDPIGDVDGDGCRDLVVYTARGSVHVLSGRSLVELHETKRATNELCVRDVAWVECGELSGLAIGSPHEGSGQVRILPQATRKFESQRLLIPGNSADLRMGSLLLAVPGLNGDCGDLVIGMIDDLGTVSRLGVISISSNAAMTYIDLSPYMPTGSVELVGDADGDGVLDLALGTRAFGQRWVNVVSGRTKKTTRIIARPARNGADAVPDDGGFGQEICAVDDCDGDGVRDLAISAPEAHRFDGVVFLISGRTGEVLREVRGDAESNNHFGSSLALADDLDHDGCADILVGMGWAVWMRSRSAVYTISGRTGAILATLERKDLE